jgi:parallel beta-helix repeat protein
VAPGTYAGGFQTTKSGTASGRIRYISDTKWGAKISSGSGGTAWDNRGNYVDIQGFEIDGSNSSWLNGIYLGGSYSSVKDSRVHHIAKSASCNSTGGSAINSDSYYKGQKNDVVANVVHDIGPAGCSYIQGIYISTSGSVVNNLVYNVGAVAIHLWHDATDVVIANNTAAKSSFGILVGAGDFYHTNAPADNVHVSNNIVYDNAHGISEQGSVGSNNTYTNNLVFQNKTADWSLKAGRQSGTITADPQFVNYAAGDFRLQSTSPAVGTGSTTYAPASDVNGDVRTAVDLGAYDYNG